MQAAGYSASTTFSQGDTLAEVPQLKALVTRWEGILKRPVKVTAAVSPDSASTRSTDYVVVRP